MNKNFWGKNKFYMLMLFIVICIAFFIFIRMFIKKPIKNSIKDAVISKVIKEKHAQGIVLSEHLGSTINSIAFSLDGTKMVTTSSHPEKNLILWDISNPNDIKNIQLIGHLDMVYSAAFSPDGNKIISGGKGYGKSLILWDISDINNITSIDFHTLNPGVWAVAFSPDGTKIVSGSAREEGLYEHKDSNCILWDTSGKKIADLDGDQYFITSVAFSPDGTKIATGDWWGIYTSIILWNISDINHIEKTAITKYPGSVTGLSFSPDGHKVVSSGKNDPRFKEWQQTASEQYNNVIVWDINDINDVKSTMLSTGLAEIGSVAFSPNGKIIASGEVGGKNNITLWNVETSEKIANLDGQQNGVWSLAFSPNGKQLASGGDLGENNLILWTLLLNNFD